MKRVSIITLGFVIACAGILSTPIIAHGDHSHGKQQTRYNHSGAFKRGGPLETKPTLFDAVVNIPEAELTLGIGQGEKFEELQLSILWDRFAELLPNHDFWVANARLDGADQVRLRVSIGGVGEDFELDTNAFLVSFKPTPPVIAPYRPGLHDYVKPELWTKDSGFRVAAEFIETEYPVVALTFIIEEQVTDEGKVDYQAYRDILDNVGIGASAVSDLVVMDDGKRAMGRAAYLERLKLLYEDPRVINIIPDVTWFK